MVSSDILSFGVPHITSYVATTFARSRAAIRKCHQRSTVAIVTQEIPGCASNFRLGQGPNNGCIYYQQLARGFLAISPFRTWQSYEGVPKDSLLTLYHPSCQLASPHEQALTGNSSMSVQKRAATTAGRLD